MSSTLHSYLLVTTLLVLTPGASTAVVVRNVIAGGRAAGLAAALGALAGNSTYALAAGLGMPALFSKGPAAILLLRLGGAGYMAWLGLRSLWSAWVAKDGESMPREVGVARHTGFRQGLATNLLNPAIATFYFLIVPTFLPSADSSVSRFAVFAAIHVSMAFAYHVTWAYGFHALRRMWSRRGARRIVETATGIALLALAARMV